MRSKVREDLHKIGKKYGTDKYAHRFKELTYLHIYDFYLRDWKWRSPPVSLLELGIKRGASLKMWKEYFGQRSIIKGVDKNPACKLCGFTVYIGLQNDRKFLEKKLSGETFDIIIDDASHFVKETLQSFQILWKYVKNGGYYCIEDIKHFSKIALPLIKYLDKRKDMDYLHFYPQLCIIGKI